MIKTTLCLCYLPLFFFFFSLFPFRLGGPVSLVELHTHCEAPKRGGHLKLGRSPETNIWFLQPLYFLSSPHWHFQRHSLIGSVEEERWRQSDPKHTRMSPITVAQLLYCHFYFSSSQHTVIAGHPVMKQATPTQWFSVSPFLLVCISHCSLHLITDVFYPMHKTHLAIKMTFCYFLQLSIWNYTSEQAVELQCACP